MSETQCLLQLKGIFKDFGTGTIDEVRALDNVSLDAYNSDFITVIGSNGAGKTTLLNVIAGVYPPDKGGKITIGGRDFILRTNGIFLFSQAGISMTL